METENDSSTAMASAERALLDEQLRIDCASMSFFAIYGYATWLDLALVAICSVCAAIAGALVPVTPVPFISFISPSSRLEILMPYFLSCSS